MERASRWWASRNRENITASSKTRSRPCFSHSCSRPLAPSPLFPCSLPVEEFPLIKFRCHRHIKESHHHLVGSLFSPVHRGIGIGIMHVAPRIVVPRHCLEFCPRLQCQRFLQSVAHLPVKVIIHPQ